ncbi:MAG: hypothetical protein MIO93_00860 [ANME-2 cluster archaeon]|jgi:hypothetical protein|nr:hypothetical protein [ANME-2 cluster archaeon]
MSEILFEQENELPEGSTLLLTAPVANTEKELYNSILKTISNSEVDNIIWICYQKVPNDIIDYLIQINTSQETIDKIHFIDMMSNMLGLGQKNMNSSYCSTPTEYNCLLRNIEQFTDSECKCLIIFDNLNALMSYDMIERMIRFIRNLNNLSSSKKCPIIYLGISGGSSHEIEISIHAAMDNIYHLQGNIVKTPKMDSWDKFKSVSWTDVFTLNSPIMFILFIVMMVTNIFLLVALSVIVLTLRF